MTNWDSYEAFANIGRQRAVELFEQEISFATLEGRESITLPLFAAKVILACAKDGQRRGQGRRRPSDSERDRIAKDAIVEAAKARWKQLEWGHGTKRQAAQEVLDEKRGNRRLGQRANFSLDHLMRRMGPKPAR